LKRSNNTKECSGGFIKEFFYRYSFQKLSAKQKILDVGCGVGHFLKLGKGRAFGIDINYQTLTKVRRYSDRLVNGDLLHLPFPDASFDAINCSHVIEHFSPSDAYQLLSEMDRVLKADGLVAISTPILWKGFFDDLTHVRPYNPSAIMHYYGLNKEQTTRKAIESEYEVEELKWRYTKVTCEPIFLPRAGILNAILSSLYRLLNKIGFGVYKRTGYTMILRKTV